MELLSWMRKVDTDLSRSDLLSLIDNMHGVIDALLAKNQENEALIKELKRTLQV
ncbi:hypothetical protein [Alkaliphilus hydrothermalis]|uniref:Uncharacterized protein n=1 Tax=Alkaliphilus hydrothermalis TaxID=1482730 RepID=A0ABS2NS79_9FIRM|nr:hypothetical protein [Alkaliphilus hydrothermalis]MBM7615429.1 hypothetical protein [Alkaliphilus hydrothermalis]